MSSVFYSLHSCGISGRTKVAGRTRGAGGERGTGIMKESGSVAGCGGCFAQVGADGRGNYHEPGAGECYKCATNSRSVFGRRGRIGKAAARKRRGRASSSSHPLLRGFRGGRRRPEGRAGAGRRAGDGYFEGHGVGVGPWRVLCAGVRDG